MKGFSIILTLILTIAWGYTSWYWYTCNVKWFCNGQIQDIQKNTNILSEKDVFLTTDETHDSTWEILKSSNSPKLSADDVLSENTNQKTQIQTKKEEKSIDINTISSGSTNIPEERETIQKGDIAQQEETINKQHTLCTNPIIGPISLEGNNNVQEVKNLEAFLFSQGEKVTLDGIYGKDEFEAIKRFQLKYRKDILDPWKIAEPTGYVYTTTIKKIQELACK